MLSRHNCFPSTLCMGYVIITLVIELPPLCGARVVSMLPVADATASWLSTRSNTSGTFKIMQTTNAARDLFCDLDQSVEIPVNPYLGVASDVGSTTALPHVIFINLDQRADRRASITLQLTAVGWPFDRIHRLRATFNSTHGMLGCNDSHLRAVRFAIASGWPSVLVVEDDVVFRNSSATRLALLEWLAWSRAARREFNVVLLSTIRRDLEPEPCLDTTASAALPIASTMRIINNSQTTAAYLVSRRYMPVLEVNFAEATAVLTMHPERHSSHSADQHWKLLQRADQWLRFDPLLADQGAGYSDITHEFADHAAAFGAYELVRSSVESGTRHVPPFFYNYTIGASYAEQ